MKFDIKHIFRLIFFGIGISSCSVNKTGDNASAGEWWLTTPDQSVLFQKQATPFTFRSGSSGKGSVIQVLEDTTFQTMDGFGFTLTGGSAQLINQMGAAERKALLQELFGTEKNQIGISYLRISIGASDLDEKVFSYNDLPAGQTDPELKKFSLAPDQQHLIPVLKQILTINPNIKILGSPWSPPTWMKNNNNSIGGRLKEEWYATYAQYFVKYIRGMAAEGIKIDAITIQNEPLHPGNNPSLLMVPLEQATFIKKNLGPAFAAANIKTKILLYDHNADRPDYPIRILDDPEARQYVDGSAFHLYGGKISALSQVHAAHPDKNLYFTEQWIGAPGNFPGDLNWHVKTLIIGASRNWCKTVLEWNLAADPQQNPHTPGGCTQCLGAITVSGNNITRNPAYYIVAHASKFVRPGSVRIASSEPEHLPNVAFRRPDGKRVLVVLNDTKQATSFRVSFGSKQASATLSAGAVVTFVW